GTAVRQGDGSLGQGPCLASKPETDSAQRRPAPDGVAGGGYAGTGRLGVEFRQRRHSHAAGLLAPSGQGGSQEHFGGIVNSSSQPDRPNRPARPTHVLQK